MIINGFLLNGFYSANSMSNNILYLFFVLLCIIIPYLIGSLNFAVIISKSRYADDVRKHGSGNGGMTNMLRTYGKRAAALTLFGDMAKAVVAVLFGCSLLGLFGGYLASFFVVFGHMFPVFFKFKGGKGVATTGAAILVLYPTVFAVMLLCFVIVVVGTKYVSLASIMSALLYPVLVNRFDVLFGLEFGFDSLFAFMTTLFVVFMHRSNIKRLMSGTESKISLFKKKDKKEDENK